MSYSALAESKMVRAGLVFASSETNNNLHKDSVTTLAAAVELMHTYSLIHDDLPCMDNDDLRRNQPSSHIKYGEANAVLAGDALQALAYEIISEDLHLDADEKVHSIKILSKLLNDNGKLGIRSVEDGVVKFHHVTILEDSESGLWITGIPKNLEIIVQGQGFVEDNQKVLTNKL